MTREQSDPSVTKLGAMVVTTAVLLASLTGGYYTYALFTDVETVGLSISVVGNIQSGAGNADPSSVNNGTTGTTHSPSASNNSSIPSNRSPTASPTLTPSGSDNSSDASTLPPPNSRAQSARASPRRVTGHNI